MAPMELLAIVISLSIPIHGNGDYTLDISPTILMEAPTNSWVAGTGAITLPGVVLFDPEQVQTLGLMGETWHEVVGHELMHVRQQQALGPAFWLAYAATAGKPFEPHDEYYLLPSFMTRSIEDMTFKESDYSRMWMPPERMHGNYPIFRIARDSTGTRLQWMPGYPSISINLN